MNFFIFLELTKLKNDSIRDIFIHSDIIINLGPNRAQAQDNFNEENDVDDDSPELFRKKLLHQRKLRLKMLLQILVTRKITQTAAMI